MLGLFLELLEDYYESIESEITLYPIHQDISSVLLWIAKGNLLDHIEDHYGPPAA